MKKILTFILAAAMLASLAACAAKTEQPEETKATETTVQTSETEMTTADTDFPDGDPVEYSREYWEAKYPGENICPFSIDEDGVERSYYWVSGFDGWNGTIESWITQPFNWNGWHKTDDGAIVNEDETLKITDDWANGDESMSSCCTVTTEKYDKDSSGSGTGSGTSAGEVKNNVPSELSFSSEADLACVENFIFTAVYNGTAEDKSEENDGLFFDFYGDESAVYYVQTGFNEDDGEVNHIWGYNRLYHFYDDADSYKAALEQVPEYNLKGQNDDALYFTTPCRAVEGESYSEIMEMVQNKETDGGDFDNFSPYMG